MNQVLQIGVPHAPVEDSPATRYAVHRRGFELARLLGQLAKAVQQHRGASMAYLSGEPAFGPLIQEIQGCIGCILEILEAGPAEGQWLQGQALDNVRNNWKTILVGWRDDQIMHNFEFHCHLVEAMKRLLLDALKAPLQWLAGRGESPAAGQLASLFPLMFENIESLAMLRGLSTNAAVVRACGSQSHARIAFELREITRRNDELLQIFDRLGPLYPAQPVFGLFRGQQISLHKYLICIRMTILEQRAIDADSVALFALATEIIDAHWLAFDQGVFGLEDLALQRVIGASSPALSQGGTCPDSPPHAPGEPGGSPWPWRARA